MKIPVSQLISELIDAKLKLRSASWVNPYRETYETRKYKKRIEKLTRRIDKAIKKHG